MSIIGQIRVDCIKVLIGNVSEHHLRLIDSHDFFIFDYKNDFPGRDIYLNGRFMQVKHGGELDLSGPSGAGALDPLSCSCRGPIERSGLSGDHGGSAAASAGMGG